jgi:hypothetical protein
VVPGNDGVHDPHVLVAVDLQLPERPCREPVVVVAVEDDRGLVVDTGLAEQLFQLPGRHDVADERVAELGRPVPAGGPGNMTLIVCSRIDVDFDDADARVGGVLRHPLSGNENVRKCHSHGGLLAESSRKSPILPQGPGRRQR